MAGREKSKRKHKISTKASARAARKLSFCPGWTNCARRGIIHQIRGETPRERGTRAVPRRGGLNTSEGSQYAGYQPKPDPGAQPNPAGRPAPAVPGQGSQAPPAPHLAHHYHPLFPDHRHAAAGGHRNRLFYGMLRRRLCENGGDAQDVPGPVRLHHGRELGDLLPGQKHRGAGGAPDSNRQGKRGVDRV